MLKSILRPAGILVLLALVIRVSVAQDTTTTTDANRITVVGSAIVAPVFERLAEASGAEAALDSNVTGTTSGLEAFCSGQADVATATRPISAEEDTTCATNGVDYIELLIGHEVLTFVTSPANTFAECLTSENLSAIFAPSAEGQVTNWTQINEANPDTPLSVNTPDENTVTYALLDQLVEGDGVRGDAVTSADANEIIAAVGQDTGAVGVVNLVAAQSAGDAVKILEVDSGTGCTLPTAENVEARVYTPAERLFVYANRAGLDKPGLRDVLTFAVSDEAGSIVESLGVTAPSANAYTTDREVLAGAESGRQFSVEVDTFAIPQGVSGAINVGGAANGHDYFQTMTGEFNTPYPGVTITTDIEGEPAGFRRLCNGEIDISVAYNDMSEEQAQNCAANNITPLTIELGSQATVLVANAASEFLQCLDKEQVTTIWGVASTDSVTNWNQVSRDSDFPDLEMTLFAPNPGDTFTDLMLIKAAGSGAINRIDTELDSDPLYRAAATANVEGALTYMSWPEYQRVLDNNQGNIQLVAIDGGNGCITPSLDRISDASYPLARPGKLIVNQTALARIEVMSFVWFLVSDENLAFLEDAGFVGQSFSSLADARNALQSAYNEAVATALSAPVSTAEPDAEATAEATSEATVETTVEATAEPANEPTVEPTVEVTEAVTSEPTVEPTAEPTTVPTIGATEEATAESGS